MLKDLEDNIIASGGMTQAANGNRVTSELNFHFKDGSTHSETTVYSQRKVFRLLSYRLVQKGKAFKRQHGYVREHVHRRGRNPVHRR